jgi:hypothetical protein
MYVLLYLDTIGHPAYTQAPNLELLNQQIRTLWSESQIDQYYWEEGRYQLLGLEENELTPVNHWDCEEVPQIILI